jgi:hypothetical protein
MKIHAITALLGTSVWALGCGVVSVGRPISPEQSAVGKRAEAELGCPQDKLEFDKIDDSTIIAKGCEKQTTYVKICSRPGSFGTCADPSPRWVKNSETTSASPSAAK